MGGGSGEWNLFKTVEPYLSNKSTEISGRRWKKLRYSAKGEELPSPEQRMCTCAQSCLTLATPWIIAHQVPLSMGFPRQEYWSGFAISYSRGSSCPRDRTHISCTPLHWQMYSLPLHHLGNPQRMGEDLKRLKLEEIKLCSYSTR